MTLSFFTKLPSLELVNTTYMKSKIIYIYLNKLISLHFFKQYSLKVCSTLKHLTELLIPFT